MINITNPLTKEILPKDLQAQEINNFFANIGEKLARKFRDDKVRTLTEHPLGNEAQNLNIENITINEVLKLVNNISVYKSSGMDNISGRVIKDFLTLAAREITILYNNILASGIFPDKWKIATVTPIPKVANAESPTDLRPISLLPVPGKILEKYITSQIELFLENKKFFHANQNGFRKGKSTSSALAEFLDDTIAELNSSKISVAAYLDFQKAFDTIDHDILLSKLSKSGIGAKVLKLLKNYLSNRQQKTMLFGTSSSLLPIKIGVPQGSTIGPTMFIVYINDLPDVLKSSKALMYADDTVIYNAGERRKTVRKSLQADLSEVQKWCTNNKMSLNVKKTKIMSFMSDYKRKKHDKFKFYMHGNVIEEVDTYKYLGTTIDNRLKGDAQFSKLSQSLGFKIRTFSRIRKFLTGKAALTVYKSTILPIIDYSDHFQMLWNKDKLDKIQKLQNWGLRVVYCKTIPPPNENELHRAAGIQLLKYRRITHMLSIMYHRAKVNEYLDVRDIPTRQFDKIKFKVIAPVIKVAFKSPNYLGAQLWDLLPIDTQTAGSYAVFKHKVQKHITAGLFNGV